MRITLNIDAEILKRAVALTGIKKKTSLVRMGPESLIAQESRKRLAQLGGPNALLSPSRDAGIRTPEMILIDTSVWINHFREGNRRLHDLLLEGEVACHPFVIGELACGNLKNRVEIPELLRSLPQTQTVGLEEILVFIQDRELQGKGIGLIDAHPLASALVSQSRFWTEDKRLKATAEKLKLSL